jgi:polar amino acid transport system ATP-binding protein/sulfate transport system ATP-binding protein
VSDYSYTLNGPLLQVKDVCVSLGGKQVLDRVSFTVRDVIRPGHSQGQIVALLGPSGSGKTTLFRRISGLETIDSGRILVGSKAEPATAGKVGVVMQHYPLFAHRSVLGNLLVAGAQNAEGLDSGAIQRKAEKLLQTFELGDRADAWPAELSGGQRQRVAIAQQLMCSEHLLLMDEPFSGLDPTMKSRACELVQHVASLHEENTIVIVTHDVESAVKICDQIIVLGKDPIDGKGTRVRADIDLKERGIAWRPENEDLPAFRETVREIKAMFPSL